MLTVKHERPSQRLKHRVTVPIKVEVAGEGMYKTRDWSLSGLVLMDYPHPKEAGDLVALNIAIPFQGFDISFQCEAEVIRTSIDEGVMAAAFSNLDDRGRDLLTHFIEEIIRGSVSTTDEVLRRIDTPVTPVTTTQEPSSEELPVKRISWKVVKMIFVHTLVGATVLGYGGYFIYQNFMLLNVTTAVISAPVNPLLSPINGYLSEVVVRPGQQVNQNQVLMRLSDPDLDSRIEFAKINVDRKLMELRVRRGEYQAEMQKNEDFQRIAKAKLKSIESQLETLKAKEILEDLRHEVIEEDYIQGKTEEIRIIDSSIRRLEARDTLDQARQLIQSRRLLLDSIERGTLIHDNIESKLNQTKVKMEFAEDQLVLSKDELTALRNQQNWMNITAPTNGQVAKWLRAPGTAVKKGEKLALFEVNEARMIKAFLTPSEVLRVGLNDKASVYFPSLDRYITAKIVDIDATSGTLSAKEIDYIWRRPNEPSARVTMEFVDMEESEIRETLRPGLPATVVFNQRGDRTHPSKFIKAIGGFANDLWQGTLGLLSKLALPKASEHAKPDDHTPDTPPRNIPNMPYIPKYPASLKTNDSVVYYL